MTAHKLSANIVDIVSLNKVYTTLSYLNVSIAYKDHFTVTRVSVNIVIIGILRLVHAMISENYR